MAGRCAGDGFFHPDRRTPDLGPSRYQPTPAGHDGQHAHIVCPRRIGPRSWFALRPQPIIRHSRNDQSLIARDPRKSGQRNRPYPRCLAGPVSPGAAKTASTMRSLRSSVSMTQPASRLPAWPRERVRRVWLRGSSGGSQRCEHRVAGRVSVRGVVETGGRGTVALNPPRTIGPRSTLEVVRSTCRATAARSGFAGFRFPPEIITLAVRWYLRFGLSYRDVEELLAERGIEVDHVTVYRWVRRFTPLFVEAARPCRHTPGDRWLRRRDVCEGQRPVASPVPGGRPVRPGAGAAQRQGRPEGGEAGSPDVPPAPRVQPAARVPAGGGQGAHPGRGPAQGLGGEDQHRPRSRPRRDRARRPAGREHGPASRAETRPKPGRGVPAEPGPGEGRAEPVHPPLLLGPASPPHHRQSVRVRGHRRDGDPRLHQRGMPRVRPHRARQPREPSGVPVPGVWPPQPRRHARGSQHPGPRPGGLAPTPGGHQRIRQARTRSSLFRPPGGGDDLVLALVPTLPATCTRCRGLLDRGRRGQSRGGRRPGPADGKDQSGGAVGLDARAPGLLPGPHGRVLGASARRGWFPGAGGRVGWSSVPPADADGGPGRGGVRPTSTRPRPVAGFAAGE